MMQKVLDHNGSKIKEGIKKSGLTQAKFAEIMGYDERTIRKWIKNGVYDYRLLYKIIDIFDCSLEELTH